MEKRHRLRSSFERILIEHLDRFPGSRVEDLYKLIFQAAMGSEHALSNPEHVHHNLQAEARGLKTSLDLPLWMPISPDRGLVRLHIRPFLAAGGDLGALARACVQTSQVFVPSMDHLTRYWSWAAAMALRGDLPFAHAELKRYGDKRRIQEYPAVHHSPQFRRLYRPAYRVVLKHLIARSME